MHYLGRFNAIALVSALLAVLATAPSLRAEPILGEEEDLPGSLDELALEAGSRAAILGQCGIGGHPVMLAFEQRLQDAGLSGAAKGQLLQIFQDARSSAAAVLARSGTSQCSGAYGLLRETIRDLGRPLS
jgi:hypothetical protein